MTAQPKSPVTARLRLPRPSLASRRVSASALVLGRQAAAASCPAPPILAAVSLVPPLPAAGSLPLSLSALVLARQEPGAQPLRSEQMFTVTEQRLTDLRSAYGIVIG